MLFTDVGDVQRPGDDLALDVVGDVHLQRAVGREERSLHQTVGLQGDVRTQIPEQASQAGPLVAVNQDVVRLKRSVAGDVDHQWRRGARVDPAKEADLGDRVQLGYRQRPDVLRNRWVELDADLLARQASARRDDLVAVVDVVQLQPGRGRLGRQASVEPLETIQSAVEQVVENARGLQAVDGLVASIDEDTRRAVDGSAGDGDRPVGAVGLHLQTSCVLQVDMTTVVDHHGARRIAEHQGTTAQQSDSCITRDRPEVLRLPDSPAEVVEANVATDGGCTFTLVTREVGVAFDDGVEPVAVADEVDRERRCCRCSKGVGVDQADASQKSGCGQKADRACGELFQGSPPPNCRCETIWLLVHAE